MCSFIGLKIGNKYTNKYDSEIIKLIENTLLDKGGDITNILIHRKDDLKIVNLESRNGEFWYSSEIQELLKFEPNDSIFGFSRLTPETETSNINRLSKIPPYKTLFSKYIATHGTIPLKELSDIDIIDTEILKFEENLIDSIKKVEKLNGKASIIEYDPLSRTFDAIHNGLGLSKIESKDKDIFGGITNKIYSKSCNQNLIFNDIEPNVLASNLNNIYSNEKEIIVSLCSGGMDAVLSTADYIGRCPSSNIEKIHIDYFNWGTRATTKEIEAVNKFAKYIQTIPIIPIENVVMEVILAKDYFMEILNFAFLDKTRLTDPDAVGQGENESEEAISYVPLRNTFLLLALVTKYEALYPNRKVTFIFGGNLTEGMVYSDNSVNYVEKMNQLIKLAGQKTTNFKLIAPFAKCTKTVMIERFAYRFGDKLLNELLDISFSCYFPKEDGSPCNECGSCNLRNLSSINIEKSKVRSLAKYVSPEDTIKIIKGINK